MLDALVERHLIPQVYQDYLLVLLPEQAVPEDVKNHFDRKDLVVRLGVTHFLSDVCFPLGVAVLHDLNIDDLPPCFGLKLLQKVPFLLDVEESCHNSWFDILDDLPLDLYQALAPSYPLEEWLPFD